MSRLTAHIDDQPMDFGTALGVLRGGGRVGRTGWNSKGMWIELQVPDDQSKMSLPYIYMSTAQGDLVPWLASQTDVLANDWELTPDDGTGG